MFPGKNVVVETGALNTGGTKTLQVEVFPSAKLECMRMAALQVGKNAWCEAAANEWGVTSVPTVTAVKESSRKLMATRTITYGEVLPRLFGIQVPKEVEP